ncbi:MAG: hypothetical protein WCD66_12925 [Rhodanobacteraceae bacterium]
MRLSTITVTALPFLLLVAMLASIVVSPRIHSDTIGRTNPATIQHVQQFPAVVVNAPTRHPVPSMAGHLVSDLSQSSAVSCSWMTDGLRMPYFSFAKPLVSTDGI